MNKIEFGNTLRISSGGEAIAGSTNTLELIEPVPGRASTIKTAADGVAVGTVEFNGVDQAGNPVTFPAFTYIEYVVKEGDITLAGQWQARLISLNAPQTENKLTDLLPFVVAP